MNNDRAVNTFFYTLAALLVLWAMFGLYIIYSNITKPTWNEEQICYKTTETIEQYRKCIK